ANAERTSPLIGAGTAVIDRPTTGAHGDRLALLPNAHWRHQGLMRKRAAEAASHLRLHIGSGKRPEAGDHQARQCQPLQCFAHVALLTRASLSAALARLESAPCRVKDQGRVCRAARGDKDTSFPRRGEGPASASDQLANRVKGNGRLLLV